MNLKDRIIRLEEIVSLQQQEMLGISKELYAQHQQNQELREQMIHLSRRLKEISNELGGNIRPLDQETPPPHY